MLDQWLVSVSSGSAGSGPAFWIHTLSSFPHEPKTGEDLFVPDKSGPHAAGYWQKPGNCQQTSITGQDAHLAKLAPVLTKFIIIGFLKIVDERYFGNSGKYICAYLWLFTRTKCSTFVNKQEIDNFSSKPVIIVLYPAFCTINGYQLYRSVSWRRLMTCAGE